MEKTINELKAALKKVIARPVNGNVTATMMDHFHYIVPHVGELLKGDSQKFIARLEMRGPFVPVSEADGFYFQGSVDPREPMEIGDNIIYGAIRLVSIRLPKPDECLSMVGKWLSKDQQAGIECGKMVAKIGISKWGKCVAITVAITPDMNKP